MGTDARRWATFGGGQGNTASAGDGREWVVTGRPRSVTGLVASPAADRGGILEATGRADLHGGTVRGDGGTIRSPIVSNIGATFEPGDSTGTLTIDGDYTQGIGGTLAVEIGGAANCPMHDQLMVTGAATLAGTLSISRIDGCQPQLDQSFDVVLYASRAGTFSPVLGMGLGNGLRFLPVYAEDRLTLTVAPTVPADFDGDGDVDKNDFDFFAACATGPNVPLDPGCLAVDLDGDGDGDMDDFGMWQRCHSGPDVPADPACVP